MGVYDDLYNSGNTSGQHVFNATLLSLLSNINANYTVVGDTVTITRGANSVQFKINGEELYIDISVLRQANNPLQTLIRSYEFLPEGFIR